MSSETRTKNSIRNILVAMGGQFINLLISFVGRSVFISVLGVNYLGISGLLGNVLSMLSLTELGIGSAIIFSMYKPLAEKDETKTKALMNMYASIYRIIGVTTAVIGLALVPFLNIIIKDKPNIPNLNLIYIMFLANSVSSYFFSYKCSIIIADQKQYIVTLTQYAYSLVQNIVQISLLIITKNYFLYLSLQIIFTLLSNVAISRKANKMYPFLKEGKKEYLDKKDKKALIKNIGAMSFHKLSSVIISGTDNILISAFVGVYWVGLYSNYYLIISKIEGLLGQIFSSLLASIGNLNANENTEKSKNVFDILFFMNFWLYSFCSISFWVLINPFIKTWLGDKFVMNNYIVFVIIINFFVSGMRNACLTYRDTLGLFWNDRYRPLFSAIINLGMSLFLVHRIGIVGVFLGTLISTITTSFWVEPFVLYRNVFKIPISNYFKKYAIYVFVTIGAGLITELSCSILKTGGFLLILERGLFCLFIPNIIIILLFFKTKEFKYLKEVAIKIVHKFNI
ncbi:oligosaccharide flippase family protein [Clostridium estertheticum]|uniref:lipopolysaccharide biosynthesis protein n=1 Tax=Clostridium estertheticum TaxID=238834 RepID=UPI0013E99BD3|nr:oligosaccharide flippase family protein [Clostridium estertheticum]MBZ9687778.1 oligosaccharide flippase family protein [Clostridium estertheticum]